MNKVSLSNWLGDTIFSSIKVLLLVSCLLVRLSQIGRSWRKQNIFHKFQYSMCSSKWVNIPTITKSFISPSQQMRKRFYIEGDTNHKREQFPDHLS